MSDAPIEDPTSFHMTPDEFRRRGYEVVDWIVKAQEPDGYLNSYFTNVEPEARWTNLRDRHELYCAGHLIEGAVAYFKATGKRAFEGRCIPSS